MATTSGEHRVYVHVGLPKTGTTFLQSTLLQHRARLGTHGVLYPGGEERMFLAALDVRDARKAWGRSRSEVDGAWDALARTARAHPGTTVLSHELLAAAGAREIVAALSMLKGLDVHVVVTARDPARQAVAEWQEGIKHGRRLDFEEFRSRVLAGDSETRHARRFRAAHDLPAVLARWGADLPADHLHVVTCPPRSAPRDLLWQRFASAVGIEVDPFPAAGPGCENASLGSNEIDLLRRVNLALDRRLVQPAYGQVVRQLYVPELLATGGSERPLLPTEMYDDLTVVAERWVKEIDRAGWRVHGRLDDLLPTTPAQPSPHPDTVDPVQQVEVAARATAALLLEVHRARTEIVRLEGRRDHHKKRRKQLSRRLRRATAG